MTDIREYLKENVLLFDGALGTYLTSILKGYRGTPEEVVLTEPETIARIHRQYMENGAKAIMTDTFAANRINFPDLAGQIIKKGYETALKAAGSQAYVFADIGPIDTPLAESPLSGRSGDASDRSADEYIWVAERFLECGATAFIFETLASMDGIARTCEFIKSKCPGAFIIVSFAILPDGYSREGIFTSSLMKQAAGCSAIDAIGMNCVQGAVHMMDAVSALDFRDLGGRFFCAMPNAGYPVVLNHRTVYEGDPSFYAQNLGRMVDLGARIVGGCCGTTPVHIAQVSEVLARRTQEAPAGPRIETSAPAGKIATVSEESTFWSSLTSGKKVIAVELDPPEDAVLDRFMKGARTLKDAGADVLTIADCPIARARMDSSLLACKIKRELDLDVLPHMTCRDRNLNAAKALLLGLFAEDVRNILLVTGDPIPTAERDEVKSVYQFNSRKLAAFVSGLSKNCLPEGFHIFGALNLNARNFDVQLRLAKDKIANGMCGFLTQPVLTQRALDNLVRAREELAGSYLLGGLIPVVSERNARYMDSEINGISVDPRIIRAYEDRSKEECTRLAIDITSRIACEIAPHVDGYYIVTPFMRTVLVSRIIATIRSSCS